MAMIDLAPGHKNGLVVANRVILGAGSVGMGEAVHAGLDLAAVGAVVVGPLTLRSRAGAPMPRLAEGVGGFVLETGAQNRGLEASLRHFGALWGRMPVPLLVHLVEQEWHALATLAQRLSLTAGVAGLVWQPGTQVSAARLREGLARLVMEAEVPVWVCLDLARAGELAVAAVEAGAAALVVGAPALVGSDQLAVTSDQLPVVGEQVPGDGGPVTADHSVTDHSVTDHSITGSLFGPAAFPRMMEALLAVAARGLDVPLIAAGGIFTLEQARAALGAGARAVQLDAVAWIEPAAVGVMGEQLSVSSDQ